MANLIHVECHSRAQRLECILFLLMRQVNIQIVQGFSVITRSLVDDPWLLMNTSKEGSRHCFAR